ncbi:hypothetical protein BJ170DRAFT_736418 [Xylariales sp. AK1849]|nr:hypothetical protein BJ170DRAFT_736418 [Xylariales sp. AK1849]
MIRAKSSLALLGLSNLATVICSQTCTFDTIFPSKQLVWCPCYKGAAVPLIKLSAQSSSTDGLYQGKTLVSPGGPGGSGVDIVLKNGSFIHNIVGTNWDIVLFDPRGTWRAEPLADCSADTATVQTSPLDSRAVPRVGDNYYKQWIEFGQQLGEDCQKKIGGPLGAGPHMFTVTNTKDILSIVDAFAETNDGE